MRRSSPDHASWLSRHRALTPTPAAVSSSRAGGRGTNSRPVIGRAGGAPTLGAEGQFGVVTAVPLQYEVLAAAPSQVKEKWTWLRWHVVS